MTSPRSMVWPAVVVILGTMLIGTAGVVALEIGRPDIDRGLVLQTFGWMAPTLAALVAWLRGVGNAEAIQQSQEPKP